MPILLLLAIALPLTPPAGEPFSKERGPHFEVVCHFEDPALCAQALEVAEATWPLARQAFALQPDEADEAAQPGGTRAGREPMRIRLLPDVESYQAIEQRLTGGAFTDNLAFSSWSTYESYIALQPRRAPGEGWPRLPMLTRRLIAHEAAHLVCYHSRQGYEGHPAWLAEGLADWVADEVMRREGWSSSAWEEPHTASRIAELKHSLQRGRAPLIERLLSTASNPGDVSRRYALYGPFVAFLGPEAIRGPLAEILDRGASIRGAADEAQPHYRRLFEEWLAPNGLQPLEREFRTHVEAARPLWHEVGRSLEVRDPATVSGEGPPRAGWTQIAFPDWAALAWRMIELVPESGSVEGWLEFPSEGEACSASVILGGAAFDRPSSGLQSIVVDFDARGIVTLSATPSVHALPDGSSWRTRTHWIEELGRAPVEVLARGRPLAWRVVFDDEGLRVELDGGLALSAPLGRQRPRGHLGLGVDAGGLVHWSDPALKGD